MLKKIIATISLVSVIGVAGCGVVQNTSEETVQTITYAEVEMDNWAEAKAYIHYNKDGAIDGDLESLYEQAANLPSVAEKCVYGAVEGEFKGLSGETLKYVQGFFNSNKFKTDFKIMKVKALESLIYDNNTIGVYVGVLADTKLNSDGSIAEESSIKECMAQLAFVKEGDEFVLKEFAFRDTNADGTGEMELFSPETAYYGLNENNRIWKIYRRG